MDINEERKSSPAPHISQELAALSYLIDNTDAKENLEKGNTEDLDDFSPDNSINDPNFVPIDHVSSSDDEMTPVQKKTNKLNASQITLSSYLSNFCLAPSTPTQQLSNSSTPLSRKRLVKKHTWKRNVAKTLRETGKEYVSYNGKVINPKFVKQGVSCRPGCTFKCCENFDVNARQEIHNSFWKLDDKSKNHYYAKFIKKLCAKRVKQEQKQCRRFSFQYFFQLSENDNLIRVCKDFFLKTLDISESRVYYFFKHKVDKTGTAKSPMKGKHVKKVTSDVSLNEIRRHIESFPKVESHYCRQSTRKHYLDPTLNIRKMYELYKEICIKSPVKENVYRKIFNEEFNLSFLIPKKDQCDLCCEYEKKTELTNEEKVIIAKHKINKEIGKKLRDADRKSDDETTAIICYDLENVFSLPIAQVSNFFYKRKFSVYNLTGHCNLDKKTYCSIWTEAQSGRSGNDIDSALKKILEKVLENNPTIKKFVLWSDSCVPQNKNRMNSMMILKFLEENLNINSIEHKYSEKGHSLIQEVDSVHSAIEHHLKGISIYSPVSLIKQMLKMNYKKVSLVIMQMQSTNFFNYNIASTNYNWLPFNKVKSILYERENLLKLKYKTSFDDTLFQTFDIKNSRVLKKIGLETLSKITNVKMSGLQISKEKIKDIESMYKYMDEKDITYYKAILNSRKIMIITPKRNKKLKISKT